MTMTKTIKVTAMYRTDDYERNYDSALGRGADFDSTCICCGRKLNPKTMKEVQAVEPGDFVEIGCGNIRDIVTAERRQVSMGWYSVGPVCYREIRRRLAESTRTIEIEL